jgi:hypothetical protein
MNKPALTLAIFLLVISVAGATDIPDEPPMKEGLWKIHSVTTTPGKPPQDSTMSLCRNHAYDQYAHGIVQKSLANCTTLSDVKLPGKRSMTVSCKISGSTITTKSIITSSGDSNYRSESESTYNPPLFGQTEMSMVQEQSYVGACPAGMAPGDRMLSTGQIEHRSLQLPAQH